MAQPKTASTPSSDRVQVIASPHIAGTLVAALHARGIAATSSALAYEEALVAHAFEASPTTVEAIELGATAARAAATGRPLCLLVPPPRGSGRAAVERAAGLAHLRCHGAVVTSDVDTWLEAIVMLLRFGLPRGPRTAVIAPPGSWLEAQTLALIAEAEAAGTRPPQLASGRGTEATDVVAFDLALGAPPSQLPGLHVPVIPRGELGGGASALFGMRAALAAIDALGLAAARIAIGLGPPPASERTQLAIDEDRRERQLAKLSPRTRVGDHETKVLLAAYGVPITRQAVAITPSAAVRAARRAGYPVELKPWGHDLPTEPGGCPVERNVSSDALVRRGFSAVLAAAGKIANDAASAVIVREPPPLGRELSVQLTRLPAIGWTVVLEVSGALQSVAYPAPLRLADANAMAAAVVATRAADPEPDREGLANLLRRASYIVTDLEDRIIRLDLPRVVVGGRGSRSVVVDAWCELG